MVEIASEALTLTTTEAQSTNRWLYEKQRLSIFPSFISSARTAQ